MFKYCFQYTTGYVGMDSANIETFDYEPTVKELNTRAHEYAVENAQMYGIEDDDEEDGQGYYCFDGVEGWWAVYDPEKHDMLIPGG